MPDNPTDDDRQAIQNTDAVVPASGSGAVEGAIKRFDRSGGDAIDGFRYQALVTLKHLLELRPGHVVLLEGSEDLVVLGDSRPEASAGHLVPEQRIQIKNTKAAELRWTDARVYKSVLEFLVQFSDLPAGKPCEFGLVTPATVGVPSDSFIARWKEGAANGAFDPRFGKDLEAKLRERIGVVDSVNLATVATGALMKCTEEALIDFAARVKWHDRSPSLPQLAPFLADRLSEKASAAGLTKEAALHLLVDTLLYRSTQDRALRVLDDQFLSETLASARADAPAWAKFAASVDLILKSLRHLEERVESQREGITKIEDVTANTLQAVRESSTKQDLMHELLRQIQRHVIPSPVEGTGHVHNVGTTADALPLGHHIGDQVGDPDVVAQLLRGAYTAALRLIEDKLAQGDGSRNCIGWYLKACAYAGSNLALASAAAQKAADSTTDPEWKKLLASLSQFYVGEIEVGDALKAITSSTDPNAALTARILIAEISYRNGDWNTLLEMTRPLVQDQRAVRLMFRGYIESGRLDTAKEILERQIPAMDPERSRLLAHLGMKQFFLDFPSHVQHSRAAFVQRSEDLIQVMQKALDECPLEAIRRRQELLANRGAVLAWIDRMDEATANIEEAIRIDASVPQPYYTLATIRISQRDFPRALTAARLAWDHSPEGYHKRIHAESGLLLAVFAMDGHISAKEGVAFCNLILGLQGVDENCVTRAELMRIRLLARHKQMVLAKQYFAAWISSSVPGAKTLAEVLIAHHEGDSGKVILTATALIADHVDPGIVHEARLHLTAAFMDQKRYAEAATAGEAALAMDVSDAGEDMVLEAYTQAGLVAKAESLEAKILTSDPRNVAALQARVMRLIQRGEIQAALKPAQEVATMMGSEPALFNAGVLLWHLGKEEEAAQLLSPHADKFTQTTSVKLVCRCLMHTAQWERALMVAMAHSDAGPEDGERTAHAFQVYTEVTARIAVPPDLIPRIRVLFERVRKECSSDSARIQEVDSAEMFVLQMRELYRFRALAVAKYESEHAGTLELSEFLGSSHAETIFNVFSDDSTHFFSGSVGPIDPRFLDDFGKSVDVLILDLPSVLLLSRIGILPTISKRWILKVSVHHLADLRGYRDRLTFTYAGAQAGRLVRLTPIGLVKSDAASTKRELDIVEATLKDIQAHCSVFDPDRQQGASPHEEMSHSVRSSIALYGSSMGAKERVVVGDGSLSKVFGFPVNVLIVACSHLKVLDRASYSEAVLRALSLGVRGLHVSIMILLHSIQRDGGRIGPRTLLSLDHLRQPGWFRAPLKRAFAALALEWANSHRSLPLTVCATAIASALHGRSFKKRTRRKMMRGIPLIVFHLAEQKGLPFPVVRDACALLDLAFSIANKCDPHAANQQLPSRRRLRGVRTIHWWDL